jgi:hypothetical protein
MAIEAQLALGKHFATLSPEDLMAWKEVRHSLYIRLLPRAPN